jgi:hypothetical protein
MTIELIISATTTDAQIEAAIPFIDMRHHATEVRDMAAAVLQEQGDIERLELHEIDGISVLYSPEYAYAYVNQVSSGVGNSLVIDADGARTVGDAVAQWIGQA